MAPQVVQYPRATSLTAHSSRTTGVEGARGPGYGARGRWRGLAGLRDGASPPSTAGAAGVEGAGGSGGHGRASRSTTPSEARVWRSRGRPDPTAPGTPAEPQATSLTTHSSRTTGVEGAGGSGGRKRAWLRCPRAVAGPGWASRRRITTQHRRHRRCGGRRRVGRAQEGLAAVPVGGGGAWPDNEPTRRATHQRPGAAGVEGAGGSGGHGRASRSTTPSEARVWRSRGRPGPTAPGTPAAPQAPPEIKWDEAPAQPIRTPRSTPGFGRPGGRRGARAR